MMGRDLLLVVLSLFFWGIGEGMFMYFQPIYLQQWGADPIQIGSILGALGVTMSVVQAPAGWLADRIGSRPLMWGSWILGALSTWGMALSPSLTWFVVSLLAYGLTSCALAPMNAYITASRGKWTIGRALTFSSAAFHFGAVAGPIAGGLLAEWIGLRQVYGISAVIFTLSTAIVLFARPVKEAHAAAETGESPLQLLRSPRFAGYLGLILITMFALQIPQPLTPNFLQNDRGLSLAAVGQLGAMGSLGNALVALLLGSMNASVGLLVGQALVGLFAAMMWLGPSTAWYAVGYLFVGGYRLCRSMALAYARHFINSRNTGLAYGLIETANAAGAILAPLAAGALYAWNPSTMYIGALVAIGGVFVINVVALSINGKVPAAAQTELEP